MNSKTKIMKILVKLVLVVQIAIAAFLLLKAFLVVAQMANWEIVNQGILSEVAKRFVSAEIALDVAIVNESIFKPFIYPIITLLILQNLRLILNDMVNGIRFIEGHVKKIRFLAWLFIVKGVLIGISTVIIMKINFLFVILGTFESGVLIGLVILALTRIFTYGVEVQTDSDMIV